MSRNNKFLNELTPMGWIVACGTMIITILLIVATIMIIRLYI